MEYFIHCTNRCDLGCNYCSVLNDSLSEENDPTYPMESLINFLTSGNHSDSTKNKLIFFGGEPLLNIPFIQNVIDNLTPYSQRNGFEYIIHSNGLNLSMLPDNIAKQMSYYVISINYAKINRSTLDDNYFRRIIDPTIAIRRRFGRHFHARLTITPEVSLFSDVMLIQPFFDSLYWQIDNRFSVSNDMQNGYFYEAKLLWEYWYKWYCNGIMHNFIPFTSMLRNHDNPSNKYHCGYQQHSIYIFTDGKCYSCPEMIGAPEYLLGSIYDGIKIAVDKAGLPAKCKVCRASPICAGRCARMQEECDDYMVNKYCKMTLWIVDMFLEKKEILIDILAQNDAYQNKLGLIDEIISESIP